MSDENGSETGVPYKVGDKKPPLHTRFSSQNQPEKNGRTKGSVSVKAELQKLVNLILKGEFNHLSGETEDMPVGRKVALNLLDKALADADLNAITKVMEHLDGKPAQALNIGGQDGENPVVIDSKMTVELVRPKGSNNE